MKGVSVIICCYNSATRLPKTLENLAKQDFKDFWELIIVDNNCNDNTIEIANREWSSYQINIPLIIVKEPTSGLSYARKKGIETAKGKYFVFCDDDNWLHGDYLSKAYSIFENHEELAVVGGIGIPVFESNKPIWFDDFEEFYATGSQANAWCVYGAGAVYRTNVVKSLYAKGFKSVLTDRNGESLSSGGDIELSMAISLMGFEVKGSDELVFEHFMPKVRCSKSYFRNLIWNIGISDTLLLPYKYKYSNVSRNGIKRQWFWNLFIKIYSTFLIEKQFSKYFSFSLNSLFNWTYLLGFLYGLYHNRKTLKLEFESIDSAPWINKKYSK